MNGWRWGLVLWIGGVMLAGCGETGMRAYDRYQLGPARDTLAAGVEALGGLSAWRKVDVVRAETIVTVYSADDRQYVSRQTQWIDSDSGRIEAAGDTAIGRWRAVCTGPNKFSLSGANVLDQLTPEQLRQILPIILHRAAGPRNLLGKGEKPDEVSSVLVDGRELTRVAVHGGEAHAAAYYFDPTSGLLQMVTAGADRPGKEGTVTLYTYQILPDGLVFPKTIQVRRLGRYVLIGSPRMLDVEFSDVRAK